MSDTTSFPIAFHVAGFSGAQVDRENAIIRGVAVITGDCEAEGHDLHVDSTTVSQLHAKAGKKAPVNLDHGSGIKDTCGYLTNFHIVANKLRADWHLLKSHDETPKMLERAEVMPECFGLSVKFKGKGEKKGFGPKAKKFARCDKLISVDCVTQPAANPDGLFSVPASNSALRVDSAKKGMPKRTDPNTQSESSEPTLADIAELLTAQQATLADIGSRLEAVEQSAPIGDDAEGEGEMSDAEIDALVQAGLAVIDDQGQARWASAEAEAAYYGQQGEGEGEGEGEGAGELAGAGASGGGEDAGAVAMSAIREIHQFRAELAAGKRAAAAAEEEHAFAVLTENVTALSAQNEELVQLCAQQEQQIAALQRTINLAQGGNPSPARSVTHLFSKKDGEPDSFEQLLSAKVEELSEAAKAEGKPITALKAKSQALDFCIRNHRAEYREYRARGGQIQLGK